MKIFWRTGLALILTTLLIACGGGSTENDKMGTIVGNGGGGNGGPVGSTGNGGESVAIFDAVPGNNHPRLGNNKIMLATAGLAGTPASLRGIPGSPGCAGETQCLQQ